jgi:hypothetical protein
MSPPCGGWAPSPAGGCSSSDVGTGGSRSASHPLPKVSSRSTPTRRRSKGAPLAAGRTGRARRLRRRDSPGDPARVAVFRSRPWCRTGTRGRRRGGRCARGRAADRGDGSATCHPNTAPKSRNAERVKMHAQIITYQLNDISQAEYLRQMVEPDAPILADFSGLISKVWLADEEENTFGGFYLWESKEAMEAFMQSDLVAAVVSRPFVKNVSSVDYTVNEAASKITRGLK